MTTVAKAETRFQTLSGLGEVRIHAAERPRAVMAFLPGFGCEASRYDWLAPLRASGVTVLVPQLAAVDGLSGMEHLFGHLRTYGVPFYLAGHSAGGALVLDALESDPARNDRLVRPASYGPPQDIAGAVVMGCSLQPRLLDFVLPHRQEDTPLTRPGAMPLLFISGSHDAIATPESVDQTAARYSGPVRHERLHGATHYGFAAGHSPTDNPRADLEGGGSGQVQRASTLGLIADFLA